MTHSKLNIAFICCGDVNQLLLCDVVYSKPVAGITLVFGQGEQNWTDFFMHTQLQLQYNVPVFYPEGLWGKSPSKLQIPKS